MATALVPNRAQLPLTFWWQNARHTLEPELLFLLKKGRKSGIAIDAGANQGLYSYALAKIFDRVEAFEPNSSAVGKLSRYRSARITIHDVALSRNESQTSLFTPVSSDGIEYAGWGSLHRDTLPLSNEIRVRSVSTRSLDSYKFDNVEFMKIDVEGHELDVLEGASDTIARCRPLILIEVKPPSRTEIWDFFHTRQYHCFTLSNHESKVFESAASFSMHPAENFFWVPVELIGSPTWPAAVQASAAPH